MKLFVAITFLTSLFESDGFVKNDLEYFAERYHSTGSIVSCVGSDPCLFCDCTEDDLKQLALDMEKYDGMVKFNVYMRGTPLHDWKS